MEDDGCPGLRAGPGMRQLPAGWAGRDATDRDAEIPGTGREEDIPGSGEDAWVDRTEKLIHHSSGIPILLPLHEAGILGALMTDMKAFCQ